MSRIRFLLVAGVVLAIAAPAFARNVLCVEDFFGAFIFSRLEEDRFVNGFIAFDPDHTWYRVEHVDLDRDQVPEEMTVRRGTYRVVKAEGGEPVIVMVLEGGGDFPTPADLKFRNGMVNSFTIAGVAHTRRRPGMPFFDNERIRKPLGKAIVVTSSPPGASIAIDGRAQSGRTPMTISEPTANEEHVLRAEMTGHMPQERNVGVGEGQKAVVHFEMQEGETQLWVKSRPMTRVFVDGKYRGDSPRKLSDIPPGDHVLALRLPALGIEFEKRVYLAPGKTVKISHDFLGFIEVRVGTKVRVYDGSKLLGEMPGPRIELPIGNRRLILEDSEGTRKRVTVRIELDKTTVFETPFEELE